MCQSRLLARNQSATSLLSVAGHAAGLPILLVTLAKPQGGKLTSVGQLGLSHVPHFRCQGSQKDQLSRVSHFGRNQGLRAFLGFFFMILSGKTTKIAGETGRANRDGKQAALVIGTLFASSCYLDSTIQNCMDLNFDQSRRWRALIAFGEGGLLVHDFHDFILFLEYVHYHVS